jgi:hypothetical protein
VSGPVPSQYPSYTIATGNLPRAAGRSTVYSNRVPPATAMYPCFCTFGAAARADPAESQTALNPIK